MTSEHPPSRRRLLNWLGVSAALAATTAAAAWFAPARASSPLGLLDLLVPKDGGSARIVEDAAYGPHSRHRLDVYAPKKQSGSLPLLMFYYGGGWNSGNRADYAFAGRAFAAMGFLTVVADYRLFPEVRFPDFLDDCGLAANWLLDNAASLGGDDKRVVLAGHSAGAYNAVMLGLQPKLYGAPRLKSRLKAVIGLSGPYDFYPFDVKESRDTFGETPDPKSTQPVNLVTASAPPMLLLHGDRDTTVQPRNTVALAAALRDARVAVTEKHYPSADHAATVLDLTVPLRWRSTEFGDISAYLAAALA